MYPNLEENEEGKQPKNLVYNTLVKKYGASHQSSMGASNNQPYE